MNAEFNWWLLIVGIVAGAGLAWLVLAEAARRERDVDDRELPAEAAWIAGHLADQGVGVTDAQAEAVLRAHRTYLGFPPPDALVDPDDLHPAAGTGPGSAAGAGTAGETDPGGPAAAAGTTRGTDDATERARPADGPTATS